MRVVHINTFDQLGGAARAAYRLHEGLQRIGQSSQMFVLRKDSPDPSVIRYELKKDILSRIKRNLRQKWINREIKPYLGSAPNGLGFFTDDRTAYGKDPWTQLPESDIIQLHWLAGFLDYSAFFAALPPGMPLVWTLHDMAPITGGCHWNQGCVKFVHECGACPQLRSRKESDWSRGIWKRKWKSLDQISSEQLHIVTPSRWLQEERKRSSLLSRFSGSVIPNGLDTSVFAPHDRRTAREALGLPLEPKIVLSLADGLNIPRKGFPTLAEALSGIAPAVNVLLLSVGPGMPPVPDTLAHIHLGEMQNDRLLSYAYCSADVFVAPSLQDNLPNTILESFACGTPVVGFDVGGIPDAVRPGVTGLLAKRGDGASLQCAILELLSSPEKRLEMSSNCRKIAVQEYSVELQAQRYMTLYQELLGRRTASYKSA